MDSSTFPGLATETTTACVGSGRSPYSCLVIGRDGDCAAAASRELPRYGFKAFAARSAESALSILAQWSFDAALLDADAFGAGHLDALRRLRAHFSAPVFVVSRPLDEHEQLLSLNAGATQLIAKPASPRLLAAQMRRLLEAVRGDTDAQADPIRLGPLAMSVRRGLATVHDTALGLTAQQFELLFLLATQAGRFVDRETIAMRLRGTCSAAGRGTDVQIYRIRRKLKEAGVDGLRLDTVYGRGYMLTLEVANAPAPHAAGPAAVAV